MDIKTEVNTLETDNAARTDDKNIKPNLNFENTSEQAATKRKANQNESQPHTTIKLKKEENE